MRNSDALRKEADRSRSVFSKSAALAAEHLQPRHLIEDVLELLDPNFRFLKAIENSLQRNPIPLIGVIAGFWIIFHSVINGKSTEITANKQRKKNARGAENKKEYDNGNEHSTRYL